MREVCSKPWCASRLPHDEAVLCRQRVAQDKDSICVHLANTCRLRACIWQTPAGYALGGGVRRGMFERTMVFKHGAVLHCQADAQVKQ
jgi:hypothetical protein